MDSKKVWNLFHSKSSRYPMDITFSIRGLKPHHSYTTFLLVSWQDSSNTILQFRLYQEQWCSENTLFDYQECFFTLHVGVGVVILLMFKASILNFNVLCTVIYYSRREINCLFDFQIYNHAHTYKVNVYNFIFENLKNMIFWKFKVHLPLFLIFSKNSWTLK